MIQRELVPVSLIFLAALSTGCGASSDEKKELPEECGVALTARRANNYSFQSTLSFPSIGVQPDSELTFGWAGVTSDFLGHEVDPMADVDTVNVVLWKLAQEELQSRLNADSLKQSDFAVAGTFYTENMATDASIFEFTSQGTALTADVILPFLDVANYPPETHTYTVMVATGDELGSGTRMIQAFKLDPASTATHVEVTPSSTDLEYSVDLRSHRRTGIPAATADVTIDWSDMTVNALGNEFLPTYITGALVARFAETPAELEERFLDLNLIATDLWRGEIVAGTSATLSEFTNEAGEPFAGIDETGTWILALTCGNCRNPAPWYLSVLSPCSE